MYIYIYIYITVAPIKSHDFINICMHTACMHTDDII